LYVTAYTLEKNETDLRTEVCSSV